MLNWTDSEKLVLPITLLIIVAISVVIFLLVRKKSAKIKRIPFIVIACLIISLEISKQIFYISTNNYSYFILPIHFCSLVIFTYPLAYFWKNENRVNKFFKSVSFSFSAIIVTLLYVYPTSLIGASTQNIIKDFPSFHTFTFHHLVVLFFVLSLFIRDYRPKLKDCFNNFIGVAFYASYAVPIAFHFNTNYVNILYSYWEPFEKFRLWAGQVWYDICLFLLGCLGLCLITILYYYFVKLCDYVSAKKSTRAET